MIQHVEEVTGNVAMTCRYFGISRHTFYRWLRRYQELGPEGLRERSRRPLVCPHATKAEVVGKILHLRQHYHFGPSKIAMYLKRYHDVSVSPSGIWRILKRANLNRLQASQRYKRHTERWKRYEKQQPGHSTQRLNGKVEPSRRIDDEGFCRLLAGEGIDDPKLFNNKLHEGERFYNFARPHGALGGLTPYERLRQLTRPSV